MADISASMVMELRQRTGLGMMECKKALTETAGDLAKAEELLRIKSGAKAIEGREPHRRRGHRRRLRWPPTAARRRWSRSIARPTSSSRNEDFLAFAQKLAQTIAREDPADVAALAALPLDGGTRRVGAPGAGAEDRREHLDPPLRALRDAGAAAAVRARRRTHRRHRRPRRWRRGDRARTSRCTSPHRRRPARSARSASRATRCRPSSSRRSARSTRRRPPTAASRPTSSPRWSRAGSTSTWPR